MPAKKIHRLLITGSTGLVGSRFVELFKNKFSIVTIGRKNVDLQLNLTSKEEVSKVIQTSDADIVINFAAYTSVDEAEKEKGDTTGEVYILNTLLPSWLAISCQATGKRLYHISTDYVFSGKRQDRPYTEKDTPTPINSWYSITKYKGELELIDGFRQQENFAIIRISYPYSGLYKRKLDIARMVVKRLSLKESYLGITDQKVKPTSVDDIAWALNLLLEKMASGIFHVAGNFDPDTYITPFNFALKIADTFKFDSALIKPVTFFEFSRGRIAPRPQHTWLDTTKIERLGMSFTNINKALNRFKQQLQNNPKQ